MVGAFLLSLGAAQQAHAATFTVTNTNDSGAGSLRQAVLDANSASTDDIITFDTTVFANTKTISLTSDGITITNNGALTINGPGDSKLHLVGSVANPLININGGANVTLGGINFSGSNNGGFGGAISNGGTLTVNSSSFSDNSTSGGFGGAIYSPNGSTLTINGSTFTTNTASLGGAIYNGGTATINTSAFFNNYLSNGGLGGAIYSGSGMLTINTCTFSSNSAPGGGAGGAIFNNGGTSTISSSTFSSNSAPGGFGGAIFNNGGTSTISSSTFSDNSTPSGNGGAISNSGTSTISSSTFSSNSAPGGFGGAIFNNGGTSTAVSSTFSGNSANTGGAISNNNNCTLTLNNNIVAGNSVAGGGNAPNISGTVSAGDYNLVNDTTGATLTGTHNITGQDPKLGSLADNGGPTKTFALLPGSPAIDAGNSALPTDQRGGVRPYDEPGVANAAGSNGSDIGAFEADAPSNSAPIVVTRTDDRNGTCGPTDCSLREAIQVANNNPDISTITFAPTVFATKQTINITTTPPTITSNVILIGPNTPGTGVTLRNTTGTGLLTLEGGTLRIANLTLTGSSGAAITNFSGTVTASGCTFLNNNFGIQNGGGDQQAAHSLTVNNCTFVGNGNTAILSGANNAANAIATVNSCTITGGSYGVYIQLGTFNLSNSIVVGTISNPGGTLNSDHNLNPGTTTQAGLDPAGLQDNGGPTPTIALVPTSPAINMGATALTTDQRGVLRPIGSASDIGAFEFNNAPTVVSVSPQGVSDKVGAKRTFTLVMSDGDGAGDIREMWLLINRQLDWSDGATLIYRPSAASPTSGQLFLRSGDNFLPPITIGTGSSSSAVLDNGAVRVVATDVSVSVAGNAITLTLPLTIRDGLVGQNGLFARVQDSAGATDPSAQAGDSGFVREGSYTVTSQFAGATNSAPTLSKLTPGVTNTTLNSSGLAPNPQNFAFFVQDADGIGDIENVWFLANKTRGSQNSATFIYYPRTRRLVLRSDADNSFLGGGKIGSPGIIENSQVRVDLSKVKLTISNDGKSLGLTLPLQAKTGLLGNNGVWLRVQDTKGATSFDGDDLGFVRKGNWNVKTNTAGDTKPSNGNS
ncbi:hypothetical protein IAD21_00641 [Abditibacteriota bacterium]|nr:hypothetical protein IAD21_00641 [Abditibacteriota bacterium]